MKERLIALDGLRGFAALSVVLGHLGLINLGIGSLPIVLPLLTFISAAHNAVQILFVLSGFLIAYLYPVVPSIPRFLKKRYGRIFPIYITVVLFLWFITTSPIFSSWYVQLPLLIALALVVKFSWVFLNKLPQSKNIGSILFYSFVFLQVVVLFFNLIVTPRLVDAEGIVMSGIQSSVLTLLTNITLTNQFVKGIPALSGVFWSLGAEMLFYILYPFIVVPLVHIARKSGIILSILIIAAVTKILLDLDNTLMSMLGLNGMNVARANGFVAGVTIGAIYQSKGAVWNFLVKIIGRPYFGIIAVLLLVLVQLGESIVGLGSIGFMNLFYLVTSWMIALVVLNAIIPNSLTYRIFRVKIITFLGLVSYSLYLIHEDIIPWFSSLGKVLSPLVPVDVIQFMEILLPVIVCVGIAALLFKTVEFLYFESKKKTIVKNQLKRSNAVPVHGGFSAAQYSVVLSFVILLFSIVYAGSYSPTLLVQRGQDPLLHPFWKEESLLVHPFTVSFLSGDNNLSVVGIDMRYEKSAGVTIATNKNPSVLKFELFDEGGKLLFSSTRNAYIVEGSPRFQFGFPTISQSEKRKYTAKLSLIGGKLDDNIIIENPGVSFISIYSTDRTTLLRDPLKFVWNRTLFIISHPNYLFAICFILVVTILARRR